MTPFDYAVLAIMAVSFLLGAMRGVVGEILALLAWVVAFMMARVWAPVAGTLLLANVDEALWRQALGFIAVFVGVLVVFAVLRWLAALLLKAIGLRPLDRWLGGLFGLIRGGFIVLLLVLLAGLTPLPRETWWRQALLSAPLEMAVVVIAPWLPLELARRIHYR